jgi:hypothetical protein
MDAIWRDLRYAIRLLRSTPRGERRSAYRAPHVVTLKFVRAAASQPR